MTGRGMREGWTNVEGKSGDSESGESDGRGVVAKLGVFPAARALRLLIC